jgi:Ion transport protein
MKIRFLPSQVPTQVVFFICSHYIIRKVCEALALLSFSVGVFRGYFTSIWTLLDLFTIFITLIVIILNKNEFSEARGGINAFVTGLLWLKVLGFLKVVNKQMATFIMSLSEILQDLKYFFVVIIVIIFMFGDMMHIVVTSYDNGLFCEENDDGEGAVNSFCSPQRTQSYLRM